jgi:hypothetical protein
MRYTDIERVAKGGGKGDGVILPVIGLGRSSGTEGRM